MKTDVVERYQKMQGKFNLPHINDLKETFKFNIEDLENIDQMRVEISDQLFSMTEKVIEHVIAGNDSFCCLFEQDMVNSGEKKKMFDLYKKIQVLKWENNLLMIKPDEKRTAEWIRNTWNLWNNELEEEVTKICKKLSDSWSDLRFKDEKTNYMG
jgi:hypothetical protein